MLIILGILILLLIFSQKPRQETMGDVFDSVHTTSVEKLLVVLTYAIALVMMIIIYLRVS